MAGALRPVVVRGLAAAVGALALIGWGASAAHAADGRVRLTTWTKVVDHGGRAVIRGNVTGELNEYLVALERFDEGKWDVLGAATPRRSGNFKISISSVEKTFVYRLRTRAPHSNAVSGSFKIRVAASIELEVTPAQLLAGESVHISGSVVPQSANGSVSIRQAVGGRTVGLGEARLADGRFELDAVPKAGAGVIVAVMSGGDDYGAASAERLLTVFRPAEATWYGPGFFGNGTACGQVYTQDILGVAHRTLPCGTFVSLFFGGKVLTVPVIDRGPYSSADWDLSAATARELGFDGRQTIGVLKARQPGE